MIQTKMNNSGNPEGANFNVGDRVKCEGVVYWVGEFEGEKVLNLTKGGNLFIKTDWVGFELVEQE